MCVKIHFAWNIFFRCSTLQLFSQKKNLPTTVKLQESAFSQVAISTASFTHKELQEAKNNYSTYVEVFHSLSTEFQFDLPFMVCLATLQHHQNLFKFTVFFPFSKVVLKKKLNSLTAYKVPFIQQIVSSDLEITESHFLIWYTMNIFTFGAL